MQEKYTPEHTNHIQADSLDMIRMFLDGNEMQVKDIFIPMQEDLLLSECYIEALNRQYGK